MYARIIGLCSVCLLGCVNFASLITTAVFRFSDLGKLAALSLAPTKYVDDGNRDTPYLDEGRTYHDDAKMIYWIWVAQLFACLCSCCFSIFINKPPSQEDLLRSTNAIAHDEIEGDRILGA